VFASSDTYRNIKRRYVFEILYGIYNSQIALLQEQLRSILAQIRQLRVQTDAFQRFLEGTPWENRAALVQELSNAREELSSLESEAQTVASEAYDAAPSEQLRLRIREVDEILDERRKELHKEKFSIEQLGLLVNQLESDIGKITRSIVAASYLHDLEFRICPRCGTAVDSSRSTDQECVLCLQIPQHAPYDRTVLIAEQDRLAAQVRETHEVIHSRESEIRGLEKIIDSLERDRISVSSELDYLTSSYVSDRASRIASVASKRAGAKAKIHRLSDYLTLLERLDRALGDLATLDEERRDVEARLDSASPHTDVSERRIEYLESEFAFLIDRFRMPRLGGPDEVRIDRRNYLPVLFGRRFRELSSQGLQVLVNVAHALAHQQTSIDLSLGLPQILFIDGLTSNLGHEGEDLERIHAVYDYLIEHSDTRGTELQIIVADNDVPSQAERYIRLRLEESERLIRPGVN
jgi:hypothetical protein